MVFFNCNNLNLVLNKNIIRQKREIKNIDYDDKLDLIDNILTKPLKPVKNPLLYKREPAFKFKNPFKRYF